MFIQVLAIIGTILGFISITLSVAAGLYYFSELIEENIELTKRFLNRSIQVISLVLVLLYFFDGFPFKLTLFSLFSYYVYHLNLKKFPNVKLTDATFILTCLLALINHYLWFQYFNNPYIPTIDQRLNTDFKMPHYPSFPEIASFFGLCIWMIPFALFISISSNENSLPLNNRDLQNDSFDDNDSTNNKVVKSVNLVRFLITKLLSKASETLNLLGVNFKFGKSDPSNPNELYI